VCCRHPDLLQVVVPGAFFEFVVSDEIKMFSNRVVAFPGNPPRHAKRHRPALMLHPAKHVELRVVECTPYLLKAQRAGEANWSNLRRSLGRPSANRSKTVIFGTAPDHKHGHSPLFSSTASCRVCIWIAVQTQLPMRPPPAQHGLRAVTCNSGW
jgi:hypothetical protein